MTNNEKRSFYDVLVDILLLKTNYEVEREKYLLCGKEVKMKKKNVRFYKYIRLLTFIFYIFMAILLLFTFYSFSSYFLLFMRCASYALSYIIYSYADSFYNISCQEMKIAVGKKKMQKEQLLETYNLLVELYKERNLLNQNYNLKREKEKKKVLKSRKKYKKTNTLKEELEYSQQVKKKQYRKR